MYYDVVNNDALGDYLISMPLLVRKKGESMGLCDSREVEDLVITDREPESG